MKDPQTPDSTLQTSDSGGYDALLIVSFGGPEGMDDVIPFLENVLRGRNVPAERMRAVAKHYEMFGGVSPINEQNRTLIAALKQELAEQGPNLPIYWGNRNWHPLLTDTLKQMASDGVQQALAFVTSAYNSYSSCRQYLENINMAREQAGVNAPHVEKLRAFYNHPLFIDANVDNVADALGRIPETRRESAELLFTAHSIPQAMANQCEYAAQLDEASRLIADRLGHRKWRLVYQSRSGSPAQPWLGPDVLDCLKGLKTTDVVIAPIGFVSDHMEIVYDLDTEAHQLCEDLGMNTVRASTAGTHPSFVKMIRELIMERINGTEPRFLGTQGLAHAVCPADSCLQN
ncbi:MAG TPA: ferrochelatase [Pyrinomonadaceae bacterium]|nr:ferrochelatase [Pyrinomonadaceae bacterium]